MKTIILAAVVTVASLFAFGSASAQTPNSVRVTVPFAFVVGEAALPAGTYVISANSNNPFMKLQNAEGTRNASAIAISDAPSVAGPGRLTFHHYGDQFFLTSISTPDSSANLHFKQSKAEKRAKTRVELAGLPAADPVLVALN